jgi:NAD(P)-dependent dehydrogenase (short-subunit alcohol dehydrogenase family)
MAEFTEGKPYYAEAPSALVVGCGGLGTSIARALGRRHPLLICDVDGERLERAVDSLRADGYTAAGYRCDITDAAQTRMLGEMLSAGRGIRVLAQVAAVGMSIGNWRRMMAVDLIGPHLIAAAAGPHMVRGGVAIFISSLASYLPPSDPRLEALLSDPLQRTFLDDLVKLLGAEPNFDDTYSYAKLGVNLLAEKLALEWRGTEVRAVSLSPGMIDSPMARAEGPTLPSHDGTNTRVSRSEKTREIPLGRQGTLLEVTNVVDFLASDLASFLNGIDIPVDGGHRAAWRAKRLIQR